VCDFDGAGGVGSVVSHCAEPGGRLCNRWHGEVEGLHGGIEGEVFVIFGVVG